MLSPFLWRLGYYEDYSLLPYYSFVDKCIDYIIMDYI